MTRQLTCLVCPNSCALEVTDGMVTGGRCKRGEPFALQEIQAPQRVLTTTIRVLTKQGEARLPVKSVQPVQLAMLAQVMEKVRALTVEAELPFGTELAVPGTDVRLLVTGSC